MNQPNRNGVRSVTKDRAHHLRILKNRRRLQVSQACDNFVAALEPSLKVSQNKAESVSGNFVRVNNYGAPFRRRLVFVPEVPLDLNDQLAKTDPEPSTRTSNYSGDYQQARIDLKSNSVLSDSFIEALDKPVTVSSPRPDYARASRRLVSRSSRLG